MAFDEATGQWWNPAGGGHADYGGNEVYRFDFKTLTWHRDTDPSPLTGRFMVDSDGDGINDACPAPSAGMPAVHSYDGVLFVPSTGEILVAGWVPFCRGAMVWEDAAAIYNPRDRSWRLLSGVPSNRLRTVYDARRDRIYAIGGEGAGTFYELDPQQNYAVVREGPYLGWLSDGVAIFDDSTRYLYYSDLETGLYRVKIGPEGGLGLSERLTPKGPFPRSLALRRPTGKLFAWDGGRRMVRVDPEARTVEELMASGNAIPEEGSKHVYSKWVYLDALDAFVGIDDPRDGVWLYRAPDETAVGGAQAWNEPRAAPILPPPEPLPVEIKERAGFAQRCRAPGVVFCDPLDTEGPWGRNGSGDYVLMPNPDGSKGIPRGPWWQQWRGVKTGADEPPQIDGAVKASGSGSLRFTYPTRSGSGGGGSFATNFSDDLSTQFGPGDVFYVQFRWRASCSFLYLDCDPASPAYKQQRRRYHQEDGTVTPFKLTIISTGDRHPGESANACTWQEVVVTHRDDHFLEAYHACGWYEAFQRELPNYKGSKQVDRQPGGAFSCVRVQPDGSIWNDANTGPNCFYLDADEWITIQVRLELGEWQPDHQGAPQSRATVWAAREGEPQRLVVDDHFHARGPEVAGERYGKIWLLPYITRKDDSRDHPPAHIWYDELIVATEPIASPL